MVVFRALSTTQLGSYRGFGCEVAVYAHVLSSEGEECSQGCLGGECLQKVIRAPETLNSSTTFSWPLSPGLFILSHAPTSLHFQVVP